MRRYVAAVAVLRLLLKNTESDDLNVRRSGLSMTPGSGLLNPVTVVRQVVSRET